jgi:ATP-dependent DNA helicase RecQ
MERYEAEELLRTAIGNSAAGFRKGQWEAIDAMVNRRQKLLLVERTGWGKSSVYFISTRILRDRGVGLTLIVSPLLALMRNQIEAAQRLGIRAKTINSTNPNDRLVIEQQILEDKIDAVLISPERLADESFVEKVLLPVADRIGLLVVDEAHCISDWGHDFRPDYQRLINILRQLPENMPLLATTATANNRVIDDVRLQLGNIEIQRGPLVRDSLVLQTLRLPDQASRLAWLAQHIPDLPGTGIVYVLTKEVAEQVSDWLSDQGILARAYHSKVKNANFKNRDDYRQHLEELLLSNKVKVLVATNALGMGYDKPDLGFVIHYQAPGSVVSYYQQVGRAGRAIDRAYGVLLAGKEDEGIHDFFRRNAFPGEHDVRAILGALERSDGLEIPQIEKELNLRQGEIKKVLKMLSIETPAPVIKDGKKWKWMPRPSPYSMDHEYIQRLTQQRETEWQEIQSYIDSKSCLMGHLQIKLDDPNPVNCGRCAVCLGEPVVSTQEERSLVVEAGRFLRHAEVVIKPRKLVKPDAFPVDGLGGMISTSLQAMEGRFLSHWKDAGWGGFVADDKHTGHFRDELVGAVVEMIQERWRPDPFPQWITCVPSLNHPELVPDFARRLAVQLGLPFEDVIKKVIDNEPQKKQQNSFHQCRNLDGVFEIGETTPEGPVFLIDDMIDSRWTITVLAVLLQRAGSGPVFPVALASTKSGD